MSEILEVLVRLMAPILSFTAEEIWWHLKPDERAMSVHLELFPPPKEEYIDQGLAVRWGTVLRVRRAVTKALEIARKEKKIGHSLDASVTLGLPDPLMEELKPYRDDLRTIFIVSSVEVLPSGKLEGGYESSEIDQLKIRVEPSKDKKCERCWVHDPTVGENSEHPTVCKRCLDALVDMGYVRS